MNKVLLNKICMAVGAWTIAGFVLEKMHNRRKKKDAKIFSNGYIKGYADASSCACDWFATYLQTQDNKKKK